MQTHNNYPHKQPQDLFEGLEKGDLARLVHPKVHIDEFKSKMGEDADVMVVSFKITDKKPANDLMNFIERGYDWVLDADVSTGELEDGEYLVFVELERKPAAAGQIAKMVDDILNLTDQKLSDWHWQYQKNKTEFPIDPVMIRKYVPLSPDQYIARFGEEMDEIDSDKDLERMKESARIPITKKAPVNEYTESIRIAAGLK